MRTLASALQAIDIAAEKTGSAHSPRVGTMADLRVALEKQAIQAGQNWAMFKS